VNTQSSFRALTVAEFVRRLSSAEPVPGGGSASAIAASLGASLVAMVASLSEGRPKYAAHAELHDRAGTAARALADRLVGLADEDASAYADYVAALRMPRETDDERAVRTARLQAAARQAAEAPLRCVEACIAVAVLAEALAGRSNVNASSDLNVAALLAEAGGRGAAANVVINLPSVGDDAWANETQGRVDELLGNLGRIAAQAREVVQRGEAREPIRPGNLPVGA
jgi:glutamate formiminotransferase/formiminotetrahydrofolate cyclodeaminase